MKTNVSTTRDDVKGHCCHKTSLNPFPLFSQSTIRMLSVTWDSAYTLECILLTGSASSSSFRRHH